MLLISWIVSALSVAVVFGAPQTDNDDCSSPAKDVWAVLVAGSKRWSRYRHQSNVCHAYKMLRANGFPEDRIITFMYNDIAYNIRNPEPGVIRNEPNGENVYKGVPIDYSRHDVNHDVFLKVLQGKSTELRGIGSGRVVSSTENENIFIYYTGLGGLTDEENGFITFPGSRNSNLTAPVLAKTFESMYDQRTYKNMLVVLESSYSGAMFENTLQSFIKVFAMTAGGPDEETWGTFCNTKLPCLAGLFSYAWLNSTKDISSDTSLFDYYDTVNNSVANTDIEHPQIYGDWTVGKLPLNNFIGCHEKSKLQSSSIKNIKHPQNADFWDVYRDEKFDKDSIHSDDETVRETVVTKDEKRDLTKILNEIIQLVIPSEDARNAIIKPEPAIDEFVQNKCFEDLLSLFHEKCTSQDANFEAHQEDIYPLKYLCDITVVNIQQMSAVEAIKKICV